MQLIQLVFHRYRDEGRTSTQWAIPAELHEYLRSRNHEATLSQPSLSTQPIFQRAFPDITDPQKGPTPAKSPTAPVPSRKTTPWVLSGQVLLPAPSLSALCDDCEDTSSQQVEQTRKY